MNNALIPLMRDGSMHNEVLEQPWQMKLKYLNMVLWYYLAHIISFTYNEPLRLLSLSWQFRRIKYCRLMRQRLVTRKIHQWEQSKSKGKVSRPSRFKHEKNDTINTTSILNGWNYLVTHLQPLKNYLFVPAKERSAMLNHP